jgi:voltage-gated potassium channel
MKDFRLVDHLVILTFPGVEKVARIVDELRADPQIGADGEIILVDDELLELPAELSSRHVHFVRGNPARDETLRRANIDAAKRAIVLAKPSDPRSDDHVLAITLAIEARQKKVRTVVECLEAGTEELLRKAGCDSVVCTSRFDAHFITSEVANPGVQEVIEELLSHLTGQQLYFSKIDDSAKTFGALSKACAAASHIAIGVRRAGKTSLNLAADHALEAGDEVVTIGAKRLELVA